MHISLCTKVLIVIQLDMFMELWKFSHVPLSLHPGDIFQICFPNLAPERGTDNLFKVNRIRSNYVTEKTYKSNLHFWMCAGVK